jgi:hypothetical protein
MVRRALLTVASVVAVVVLAGCRVDVTVDVVVADDGSGTVTVTAVADPALVAEVPELAEDVRTDDLTAAGWTVDGPAPTPEGGLQVVLTRAFSTPAEANAVLAQLGGPDGPILGAELARASEFARSTWTFDGTLQVTGGIDAFADDELLAALGASPYADDLADVALADALGIELSLTLPDEVDETTGTAQGAVVRWTVPMDGTAVDLATLAEETDRGARLARTASQVAQLLFVAWLVVATTFIVYVVVARRRRRAAPPPA